MPYRKYRFLLLVICPALACQTAWGLPDRPDPRPPCENTGTIPYPKSIQVCGAEFRAWMRIFIGSDGRETTASGHAQVFRESFYTSLLASDSEGSTIRSIIAMEEGTRLFWTKPEQPSNSDIVAQRFSQDTGNFVFSRYASNSLENPIYAKTFAISEPFRSGSGSTVDATATEEGGFAILWNVGPDLRLGVFSSSGEMIFTRAYITSVLAEDQAVYQSARVRELDDGYLLEFNTIVDPNDRRNPTRKYAVLRLSRDGDVQWAKSLPVLANWSIRYLQDEDEFLFSSRLSPTSKGEEGSVIARVDQSGETLWARKADLGLSLVSLAPLEQFGGNRQLLSGTVQDENSADHDIVLVSMDFDGNLHRGNRYNVGYRTSFSVRSSGDKIVVASLSELQEGSPYSDEDCRAASFGFLDSNLEPIAWKRHPWRATSSSAAIHDGTSHVTLAVFREETRSLDLISMNADGSEGQSSSLFEDIEVDFSSIEINWVPYDLVLQDLEVASSSSSLRIASEELLARITELSLNEFSVSDGFDPSATVALPEMSKNKLDLGPQGGSGTFSYTHDFNIGRPPVSTSDWIEIDSVETSVSEHNGRTTTSVAYTVNRNLASGEGRRRGRIVFPAGSFTVYQENLNAPVVVDPTQSFADVRAGPGSGSVDLLVGEVDFSYRSSSWVSVAKEELADGMVRLNWSIADDDAQIDRVGYIVLYDQHGAEVSSIAIRESGQGGSIPINLSARTQVGVEENILIPGFAVGGPGTTKVLIRGIGPELTRRGRWMILRSRFSMRTARALQPTTNGETRRISASF